MAAKMRNMGEACTAANRFLVHESVAEEFSQKFAAKLKALKPGNGLDEDSTVGPMIEKKALDSVTEFVQDALEKGASAVVGGKPVDGPGYFFEPTLLTGVTEQCRVFQEEIFGPVAPVITFTDEDDAVRLANTTEYGLASYVFTEDISRALRIGERIEYGLLGLNVGVISNAAAPFGGVKESGVGREGGAEGIAEYTTVQYMGMPSPWA